MTATLLDLIDEIEQAKEHETDQREGRARNSDPLTSHLGAVSISYRSGSQKAKLLQAYATAGANGLTDEEAAERAGLSMRSCYWKRCSELRQDGYVAETGQTRLGSAGVARLVCSITNSGTLAASLQA